MPTGAERLDSSLDTQENELYEFSQKLNELNIQTLQSLNIKSPEAIKDGGWLNGEELKEKQEHFSQFLDLPQGYKIDGIFYNGKTGEFKVQLKFTPQSPTGIKTEIMSFLYLKKEYIGDNSSLVYKSYDTPFFRNQKKISEQYKVGQGELTFNDIIYDIPNLTDKTKQYKKLPFNTEYNEKKTDEHCKKLLESAKTSCENGTIDKNIPDEIKKDVFYTDYQNRTYETSILNQYNLTDHLQNGIQLDKNTQKEGDYYVKKLMIRNGKENIPLNTEIKYKINEEGKLVIDKSSLGTQSIKIDGFEFKNITIKEDPKNPLNVKITFDQTEVQEYGNHMKKGIVTTYKAMMQTSFSGNNSFNNLNDKTTYYQAENQEGKPKINIRNLIGYYHLQLNNTTSIPMEFDGKEVKLKDQYGKNVNTMNFEYLANNKKQSTTAEIGNGKLVLTDKTDKIKDYQYFDFELPGMNYQNIQGHFQEGTPNFLLTGTSGGQIKNLTELQVDYDEEKGYSFDKEKNKIKLEAKYFYNSLPKIGNLNGKVAGLSDISIKNLFDKKFEESKLGEKEIEGAIIDDQYCSIDAKGNKITIKRHENPSEVTKIINDIQNLINATQEMAEYKVAYNGKNLEDTIGGVNGLGSYFKIENIDSDPKFHCFLTQLNDEETKEDTDIKFNYTNGLTGSSFSLDSSSENIQIDTTKAKVSINKKAKTINLKTA